MVSEPIVSYIIEKALDILPRWLIRALLPLQKIAGQVELDLRSTNPIDI